MSHRTALMSGGNYSWGDEQKQQHQQKHHHPYYSSVEQQLQHRQEEEEEDLIPPYNFSLVCPGVYRSAYPTPKNFRFLTALRLRTVISLCAVADDIPCVTSTLLPPAPTDAMTADAGRGGGDPKLMKEEQMDAKIPPVHSPTTAAAAAAAPAASTHTTGNFHHHPQSSQLPPSSVRPLLPPRSLREYCASKGLTWLQFSLEENREPFSEVQREVVDAVIAAVMDVRRHPLLVHCERGRHRTGTICGCIRRLQQWALVSVYQDYTLHNCGMGRLSDYRFLDLYDPVVRTDNLLHLPLWLLEEMLSTTTTTTTSMATPPLAANAASTMCGDEDAPLPFPTSPRGGPSGVADTAATARIDEASERMGVETRRGGHPLHYPYHHREHPRASRSCGDHHHHQRVQSPLMTGGGTVSSTIHCAATGGGCGGAMEAAAAAVIAQCRVPPDAAWPAQGVLRPNGHPFATSLLLQQQQQHNLLSDGYQEGEGSQTHPQHAHRHRHHHDNTFYTNGNITVIVASPSLSAGAKKKKYHSGGGGSDAGRTSPAVTNESGQHEGDAHRNEEKKSNKNKTVNGTEGGDEHKKGDEVVKDKKDKKEKEKGGEEKDKGDKKKDKDKKEKKKKDEEGTDHAADEAGNGGAPRFRAMVLAVRPHDTHYLVEAMERRHTHQGETCRAVPDAENPPATATTAVIVPTLGTTGAKGCPGSGAGAAPGGAAGSIGSGSNNGSSSNVPVGAVVGSRPPTPDALRQLERSTSSVTSANLQHRSGGGDLGGSRSVVGTPRAAASSPSTATPQLATLSTPTPATVAPITTATTAAGAGLGSTPQPQPQSQQRPPTTPRGPPRLHALQQQWQKASAHQAASSPSPQQSQPHTPTQGVATTTTTTGTTGSTAVEGAAAAAANNAVPTTPLATPRSGQSPVGGNTTLET